MKAEITDLRAALARAEQMISMMSLAHESREQLMCEIRAERNEALAQLAALTAQKNPYEAYAKGYNDGRRNAAAGAAPVPEWISVADQLPENDDPVLVWHVNGRYEIDSWQEMWEDPIGMGGQGVCVGHGWNGHDHEDITHWMLLAAAPKEPS